MRTKEHCLPVQCDCDRRARFFYNIAGAFIVWSFVVLCMALLVRLAVELHAWGWW